MECDTFNVQGIISKLKNKLANNKLSREGLLNEIMEFVVNPMSTNAELLSNSRSETIFANNYGISSVCDVQCIPCAGDQIPRPCRDPVGPNNEIENPCNIQRFCREDAEEEEEEEEEEECVDEEEDDECEEEEEEEEEEEPDPCRNPCRDPPEVECDDEEEEEEEEEEEDEQREEEELEKGKIAEEEAEKKPEDDGYLAEEELQKICSKYRSYDKKAQCREQICKKKRLEEKAKKEAEEKAKEEAEECEEEVEVDPCEAVAIQDEEEVCEEDVDCSCVCSDDTGSETEYHSGDLIKPRPESETKTSRSRSRDKSPKGDYTMYRSNRTKSDTSDCAFEAKPRSPKRRSVSPKSSLYFGEIEKPVVVQRKRSVSKERKDNDYYTGYPGTSSNLSGKVPVKNSLSPSLKKSNESLNYLEKYNLYNNRNNNNNDDDDDDNTTAGGGDAGKEEIDEIVVASDESSNNVDGVVQGEADSALDEEDRVEDNESGNEGEVENQGGEEAYQCKDDEQEGKGDGYESKADDYQSNEDVYQGEEEEYQCDGGGYENTENDYQSNEDVYQGEEDEYQCNRGGYDSKEDDNQCIEDVYQGEEDEYQCNGGGYESKEDNNQCNDDVYQGEEDHYQCNGGGYESKEDNNQCNEDVYQGEEDAIHGQESEALCEEGGPQDDYHNENQGQGSDTLSQSPNYEPCEKNTNVFEALKWGESKCVNTSYNSFLPVEREDSDNEGCYHKSERNCSSFWGSWPSEQVDTYYQHESVQATHESSDEETYCRTPPAVPQPYQHWDQASNSDDEIYFTRDPDDKESYLIGAVEPNVPLGAFTLPMRECSPIVTLLSHDRNSPLSGFLDFSTPNDLNTQPATDTTRQPGDSELCVRRLSECSPIPENPTESRDSSVGMSLASFTIEHCLRIFESLKKKALGQDDIATETFSNLAVARTPVRSAPNTSISASSPSFVEPVNFRKSIGGTTQKSKYYKRESHSAQRKNPTDSSVIREVRIIESPVMDSNNEVSKASNMLKEDTKAAKFNSVKSNKSPIWKSNSSQRSPKSLSPRPAQVTTVDSVFFGSLQESLSFNKASRTKKSNQQVTEKKVAKNSSEQNRLVEKEEYEGFGSVKNQKNQRSSARGESGESAPKNFSFSEFHKKYGEKKDDKKANAKLDKMKLAVKKSDSDENHKHSLQNAQKNSKSFDGLELKNKQVKASGVNAYGDSSKGYQKIIESKQFLAGLQKYIGKTIGDHSAANKEPNNNNKIVSSKGHERSRSTHSWKVSSRSSVSDSYRTNGQKLTEYKRIKDKAQQQHRRSPNPTPPSSNGGQNELMERIIPLEFCDGYVSSKAYPVQNVSYTVPHETGNVPSDGVPLNEAKWWSQIGAVNIVHTQELHRDMKQGNSLIQEIIELARNGQNSSTTQNIQTVAGYSGDYINQDNEAASRCENPSGDGLQVNCSGADIQGDRGDSDVMCDTEMFISDSQALKHLQAMLQSDGKTPSLPVENESTSQGHESEYYEQLHPESSEKPESEAPDNKWVWRAGKSVPRAQECGFQVDMPPADEESPKRRMCIKPSPVLALTRNVSFHAHESPNKHRSEEETNNNKSADDYSSDGNGGRTSSPNSALMKTRGKERDSSLKENSKSPQTEVAASADLGEETQSPTAHGTNRKVSKWVQMRTKKNEKKEREKILEESQDMSSSVDYIPDFTTTENDIRLMENDIKLATFQQHGRKENDSSYSKKKLLSSEREDAKHPKQFVNRPRWKSPQPQETSRKQWILSKNKQEHYQDSSASEDLSSSRSHKPRDGFGKERNDPSNASQYQSAEIIKAYTPNKGYSSYGNSRPKPSSYRMRSSASDDRISREVSRELALKIAKKREEFIKKASSKNASAMRQAPVKIKEDSRSSRSEHFTSQIKEENRSSRSEHSTIQVKEENRNSRPVRPSASQRKIRSSTSKENIQKSLANSNNKRTTAFNAKKSELSKRNKKTEKAEKEEAVMDREAEEDNTVEETSTTRGNYTKHGLKSFKVESSKSTNSSVNIREYNPGNKGFENRTNAQAGSVADAISRALNNDQNKVSAYQSVTSFDPDKVLRQQRYQAVSKNTTVIDYSTRYGNKEKAVSSNRPCQGAVCSRYSDGDPVDMKPETRRPQTPDMSYFEPGSPEYSNQPGLKAKQDSNIKLSETDHSYMSYNEYSTFRGSLNTHEPRPRSERNSGPQINHYLISKSQKALDNAEVLPPSSFRISSAYPAPSILSSTPSKNTGPVTKSSGSVTQVKKSGSATHLKGILSKTTSKDKSSASVAAKNSSPAQARKVGSATQIKHAIKPSRPKPNSQPQPSNNQKSKSIAVVEETPAPPKVEPPEIVVEEVSALKKPDIQNSPPVGILSRIFSTFSRQAKQCPKPEETKTSKSKSEDNFPKSADKLIKKSEANKKKNMSQSVHGKGARAENTNHNALPLGLSTEDLGMREPEGMYLLHTDKQFQIAEFQNEPVRNLNSISKVNLCNVDDSTKTFLPSEDYMLNINWNADTYLAERKRKKAEFLENERKKREAEKQAEFLREQMNAMQQKQQAAKPPPAPPVLEDDQIALIEEARRNDPKGPICRWKKCKQSLEGSSLAELDSTLTTLIEWNIILLVTLILLVLAGFVPGLLPSLLACPIPSAWKGFTSYFLVPLGLDVIISRWFEPSRMSLWSLFHLGAKEPSKGVFYSFVYSLVLAMLKAIVYLFGYVIIPLLSLPFLIIGPIFSAVTTATMCTTQTVFASMYSLFTSITGLSIMRSNGAPIVNSAQPYTADAQMPGYNEINDDYVADVTTKLHHLRKHGSFLFYFGFDHPKPECNFSYLTGVYLSLTGRYPKECN